MEIDSGDILFFAILLLFCLKLALKLEKESR
jgi:hypothetical protein